MSSTRNVGHLTLLEKRRQELALDMEDGVPGAADELLEVEGQITAQQVEARVGEERHVLAERERGARAESAAADREEARRLALEEKRGAELSRRRELAGRVDLAADALVQALEQLTQHQAGVLALSRELGVKDVASERLPTIVDWQLSWRLGRWVASAARPGHAYRKSLVEILFPEPAAGDGPQ
jgi:hypothetical protein